MTGAVAVERSAAGAHFQLFASAGLLDIRWRLLSGNNREIGRGNTSHPDVESCLQAISELTEKLVRLEQQIRRKEGQLWQWTLAHAGEAVVIGAHLYDRRVRCVQAMEQFLSQARGARASAAVTIVTHRRWMHNSAGHSPMDVGTSAAARIREVS